MAVVVTSLLVVTASYVETLAMVRSTLTTTMLAIVIMLVPVWFRLPDFYMAKYIKIYFKLEG